MGFNPRAMAFFILALASLGIAGYMFKNGESLSSNGFSFDLKLPTGWFVSKEKAYIKASLNLNGTYKGIIQIKFKRNPLLIEIPANAYLMLDSFAIAYLEPSMISLNELEGKATIMPYKIEISGSVKSVTDKHHTLKNTGTFYVEYNGSYNTLIANDLPSQTIIIPEYTGKIEVHIKGDKVIYEASRKNVEIKDFEGKLIIKDGRIELQGEGLLRTDVLEVYAETEE